MHWWERVLASLLWGLTSAILPILWATVIARQQDADFPSDAISWLFALQPFFLLALTVGVVATVAGKLWGERKWRGGNWILFVASLGVIAEWLTLFLPLPVHLAITQVPSEFVILSLAPTTGIWGISWLVWFAAAMLANFLLGHWHVDRAMGFGVGFLALMFLFAPVPSTKGVMRVAVIQNSFDDPLEMAEGVRHADLIVLPEVALGMETPLIRKALKEVAAKTGAKIVAGLIEVNPPYNAAVMINPEGVEMLRHRKIHLFGAERWQFKRGREVEAAGDIGIAICFDTVFPDVVRQLAQQGAKVIAVPNHDPPVVGFLLHHLHAAFLPIRAAENLVAIVKADSTGLSQVIHWTGQIVAEAPLGKSAILRAMIALPQTKGYFYTAFGDWFVVSCALMAIGTVAGQWRRAKVSTAAQKS
jgi:apolipoprotein N-acyltransferase